jgi:hypothetical protein
VSAFRPKWVAVTGTEALQNESLVRIRIATPVPTFAECVRGGGAREKVTNWIDSGGARARRCNDDETATSRPRRRGSRTTWPIICTTLLLGLIAQISHAHDHSRPELNRWFDSLKSGKGPCCSDADGYAVSDPDWESKSGHYRVRIEGEWYDVPDDAVITEPNRVGRTMVWPIKGWGGMTIRCFMPGAMT